MDAAATKFQQVLDTNNLKVQLTRPEIKYIENGGVIIEPQRLFVQFINPALEEVSNDQPNQPKQGINEQTGNEAIPEKA